MSDCAQGILHKDEHGNLIRDLPPHAAGETCVLCEDAQYDWTECATCEGAGVDAHGNYCRDCFGCGGLGYSW